MTMPDPPTDPVVEEPLTGEPIRKSILDGATGDPVAEAWQELDERLTELMQCAFEQGHHDALAEHIGHDLMPDRRVGRLAAALLAADRYAAAKALAAHDELLAVWATYYNETGCPDPLAASKALREALEKEASGG